MDVEPVPTVMIGYSIDVYDLTADPELHCRLAGVYAAAGEGGYQALGRRKCPRPPPPDRRGGRASPAIAASAG